MRFHLLTLVISTFVAGGLLYLNVTPKIEVQSVFTMAVQVRFSAKKYGWPRNAFTSNSTEITSGFENPKVDRKTSWNINWAAAAIDIGVAIALLVTFAVAFEYLVYRRKRRLQ